MSLPVMQGTARLIDAPELRFSAAGKAVVKVRLAFNARRKDQVSGEWVDGDSFFVDGTAFDKAAENIAETLDRAMEVVVSGRLRTESWESREGEKRSKTSLLIDSIGPSLRNATAQVSKTSGGGGGQGQQGRGSQFAPGRPQAQDPWASQAPARQAAGGWGNASDEVPF